MTEKFDITHMLVRFDSLEEKYGVEVSGLRAEFLQRDHGEGILRVMFDVTCPDGLRLPANESSLSFRLSVYNNEGQVVDTASDSIWKSDFDGFATLELTAVSGPESVGEISKLLLRPTTGR